MNTLSMKQLLLLGITLFSMFFGAGNLIFPPFLGYESGERVLLAFIGFVITAVIFPVLGVAAAAWVGGIDKLCEKVHPLFGKIFTIVIYICIGPLLAIPRTAGTSYAMFDFITAKAGEGTILGVPVQLLLSIVFSALFFTAAGLLARDPAKLKDILGKRMTPILLFLIAVMFIASLFHPELVPGLATDRYASGAITAGFVDGYQTLDTLAAMVFGIVIALNIRAMGVSNNKDVAIITIKSGVIAGTVLALIYGILAFMGADSITLVDEAENGTAILSALCGVFFGRLGPIILAAIFFLACFNVCVGLLASCAEYFSENFRFLSFNKWLVVFTVWSFVISIMGLDAIIRFSTPILNLIYPVALVIIALNLIPLRFVQTKAFFRVVVVLTFVASLYSLL